MQWSGGCASPAVDGARDARIPQRTAPSPPPMHRRDHLEGVGAGLHDSVVGDAVGGQARPSVVHGPEQVHGLRQEGKWGARPSAQASCCVTCCKPRRLPSKLPPCCLDDARLDAQLQAKVVGSSSATTAPPCPAPLSTHPPTHPPAGTAAALRGHTRPAARCSTRGWG